MTELKPCKICKEPPEINTMTNHNFFGAQGDYKYIYSFYFACKNNCDFANKSGVEITSKKINRFCNNITKFDANIFIKRLPQIIETWNKQQEDKND